MLRIESSGFAFSTTRSARLPRSIVPSSPSSFIARAETIVAACSASIGVSPASTYNSISRCTLCPGIPSSVPATIGTPIAAFQPGVLKIPAPLNRVFSNAGAAGIDAPTARTRLERSLRIVKALHDAGVPIVAGTDEGIPGHSVHREIELYVEAGFSPMEALQAATIVPARAMKLDGELGTLERGKRADLAVLDASPLEAIRNIRRVRWTISDGRVYDAASLWTSVRFQP